VVTLDTLAMYCHTYLGHFSEARQLAGTLTSAQVSDPLTEVLCPGVISQAAYIEGALEEAAALAASTLAAARRLHFDRHYFAFHALRTTALLALERGDLDAAAEPVERALGIVSSARPAFNYLAQLDRARIWAAGGNLDAALASLPAARSALKSDHSVLLAQWSGPAHAGPRQLTCDTFITCQRGWLRPMPQNRICGAPWPAPGAAACSTCSGTPRRRLAPWPASCPS